jgi:hypothetical protein
MRQQLENNLYEPIQESKENLRVYQVRDLESLSASALYGDMDRGYDFKESGFQLHIHEDSKLGITKAKLKGYDQSNIRKLSNYEALMGEMNAVNLGIPKIKIGS